MLPVAPVTVLVAPAAAPPIVVPVCFTTLGIELTAMDRCDVSEVISPFTKYRIESRRSCRIGMPKYFIAKYKNANAITKYIPVLIPFFINSFPFLALFNAQSLPRCHG